MHVLDERPARDRAVVAADREHRELAVEGEELLEDAAARRRAPPTRPRRRPVAQHALALAVVAAAAGLEHRGQAADGVDRGGRARRRRRPARTPGWRSRARGTSPSPPAGPARPRVTRRPGGREAAVGEQPRRARGHPLPLEGHHVGAVGDRRERRARRRARRRRACPPRPRARPPTGRGSGTEPERDPREPEHAAELAAAEHRDRRRFGIHRERVRDDLGRRREFRRARGRPDRVPDVAGRCPSSRRVPVSRDIEDVGDAAIVVRRC